MYFLWKELFIILYNYIIQKKNNVRTSLLALYSLKLLRGEIIFKDSNDKDLIRYGFAVITIKTVDLPCMNRAWEP